MMPEDMVLEVLRQMPPEDLCEIIIKIAVHSIEDHDGGDCNRDGISSSEMWGKCQLALEEKGYYYNLPSFEVFMKEFMEDYRD